jgi:uncharacterized protein (UPF0261 family)
MLGTLLTWNVVSLLSQVVLFLKVTLAQKTDCGVFHSTATGQPMPEAALAQEQQQLRVMICSAMFCMYCNVSIIEIISRIDKKNIDRCWV